MLNAIRMASYRFRCRDIGMDCQYEVTSKKAEDLIPQIVEHAKNQHGIEEINEDLKQKINGAIKRRMF
jgi:predicted small metal-binding protein